MKMLFFTLIPLLFCCAPMSVPKTAAVTPKVGCESLLPHAQTPAVTVWANGRQQAFRIDTGAQQTVFSEAVAQPEIVNLQSRLFDVPGLAVLKTRENLEAGISGSIGMDAFTAVNLPLLLNFTDGQICNISHKEFQNRLATKAFRKVTAKRVGFSYAIEVVVSQCRQWLTLDTAYDGSLLLPESNPCILEIYNPRTSKPDAPKTYEKVPVTMAGFKEQSFVCVSSQAKTAKAGMAFLRGFDWILDHNSNTVYAKRNHHALPVRFPSGQTTVTFN